MIKTSFAPSVEWMSTVLRQYFPQYLNFKQELAHSVVNCQHSVSVILACRYRWPNPSEMSSSSSSFPFSNHFVPLNWPYGARRMERRSWPRMALVWSVCHCLCQWEYEMPNFIGWWPAFLVRWEAGGRMRGSPLRGNALVHATRVLRGGSTAEPKGQICWSVLGSCVQFNYR